MQDEDEKDLDEAEARTENQFATKIKQITKMSEDDIKKICPNKIDEEKLYNLINIVKGSTKENDKKANLVKNIDSLSDILLKVLNKFL